MHKGTHVFSRAVSRKYADLALEGHEWRGFKLLQREIQDSLPRDAARVSDYPLWATLRWAGLSGRLTARYETIV